MESILDHVAAEFVLGTLDLGRLPSIAASAMEAGADSPALRRLAGTMGDDSRELKPLLRAVLAECEATVPEDEEEALAVLAVSVAREIVVGTVSPSQGAARIWDLSLNVPTAPRALHAFIYAASEWGERPEFRPQLETGIVAAAHRLIEQTQPRPVGRTSWRRGFSNDSP